MSIKKLSRKRASRPSNLTIRMAEDRMAYDRMTSDRGLGTSQPSSGPTNSLQRSEDVHKEDSSKNK
jgi:hypothetical protein